MSRPAGKAAASARGFAVMRWHLLVVSGLVTISAAGVGCGSDRPMVAAANTPPQAAPPAEIGPPAVARSQKDEPAKSNPIQPVKHTSILDSLPDYSEDVTSGQVAARIRATVNGVPVFDEEVQAAGYQVFQLIRQLPEPERSRKYREIFMETLDQLVEREVILQDAFTRLEKINS